MAYRLGTLAFLLIGSICVACGGGTGSSAVQGTQDDGVPSSADDTPPSSADDAPPSNAIDAPPGSADDAPPGSADSPGGGDLKGLCEDVCRLFDQIADCGEDVEVPAMGQELCQGGCDNLPSTSQPIPCQREIAALFDCVLGLGNLCSPDISEQQAARCQSVAEDFSECEELQGDTQQPPGGDNPGEQDPLVLCATGEDCSGCADDCSACICETDVTECLDICAQQSQ